MERMRRPGPRSAWIAVTLVLVSLALAGAAEARRARQPLQLRIEGFFAAAPEGVRPMRTIEVRIGRELTRTLAVRRLVNLSSGSLGASILDEASRFRPSFRMTGDRALLARLESAPDGRLVTITGNLTSGRHVLLSVVDVEADGASDAPATGGAAGEPAPTASPPAS